MPQDKRRVYRQTMLAERRRLQKALEALESGQELPEGEHPQNRDGAPMTHDEMRARIADLERQLHIKPASQPMGEGQ
jgi:hypothetical protein